MRKVVLLHIDFFSFLLFTIKANPLLAWVIAGNDDGGPFRRSDSLAQQLQQLHIHNTGSWINYQRNDFSCTIFRKEEEKLKKSQTVFEGKKRG